MKNARWATFASMTLATLVVAGCASQPSGDAVPLITATTPQVMVPTWQRTELVFSLGDWSETALSTEAEARWLGFLEREVTPRFPDGVTVVDAYGQWKDAKAESKIGRERSRVLVIVHMDAPVNLAKIEEIRAAWKHLAGNRPVLRVTQPADVSL